MKKVIIIFIILVMTGLNLIGGNDNFKKLEFLYGKWSGTGSGFGNAKSIIKSEFKPIMNGLYIEVINDSKFEPTKKNKIGEHHLDKGIISFDKIRKLIIFRQFNIEGYVNQYILNETISNDKILVFETEKIENFMPGGKAKWTIKKISEDQIETIFDVSFPGKAYTCFGTNNLKREK